MEQLVFDLFVAELAMIPNNAVSIGYCFPHLLQIGSTLSIKETSSFHRLAHSGRTIMSMSEEEGMRIAQNKDAMDFQLSISWITASQFDVCVWVISKAPKCFSLSF